MSNREQNTSDFLDMLYTFCMKYNGQSLEQLLKDYGGTEVSPMSVYGDIFQLGDGFIQSSAESHNNKANPIILGCWDGKIKREVMFEDTFEQQLYKFQQADWAILNGLTYWGKRNLGNSQSQICAFIIDLDGITPQLFNNFLNAAFSDAWDGNGAYPIPNWVILSGTNVHLYYWLEIPITLYPKAKQELKKLKYGLIRKIWNRYTSEIEKPQFQGINQGFRVIGGKTKKGGKVKAYYLNGTPYTIGWLNEFVFEDDKADVEEVVKSDNKYTLEQAKQLFPEWYERVVVNGGELKKWTVKEDLYRWWLRKLQADNATYGHRYFCIMALAIFAAKCGILDKEKVKADAMQFLDKFNEIKPDEPFTEHDIDSALECLDLRYCTFPRKDLEKITAVAMPPNKRNGRSQADHLKIARGIQKIQDEINGTNWRYGNSRKGTPNKRHPKKDLVLDYAKAHPDASQRQIAKALGISLPTVNKWLKTARDNT